MQRRVDRVILAAEMAAVVPLTLAGGLYSILGLYVSVGALIASAWTRSARNIGVFVETFALAAGGLAGLLGLWAVLAISAGRRQPSAPIVRIALAACAVGVLTAAAAVILMARGSVASPWTMAVVLAPVVVVLHRAPAIARLGRAPQQ